MFKVGEKVIYKPSGIIGIITKIENRITVKIQLQLHHDGIDNHAYICTSKENLSLLREEKLKRILK